MKYIEKECTLIHIVQSCMPKGPKIDAIHLKCNWGSNAKKIKI